MKIEHKSATSLFSVELDRRARYNEFKQLNLSEQEKKDLLEYLKSL